MVQFDPTHLKNGINLLNFWCLALSRDVGVAVVDCKRQCHEIFNPYFLLKNVYLHAYCLVLAYADTLSICNQ